MTDEDLLTLFEGLYEAANGVELTLVRQAPRIRVSNNPEERSDFVAAYDTSQEQKRDLLEHLLGLKETSPSAGPAALSSAK